MSTERTLEAIWKQRSRAFRVETLPYLRYMGQSGFPAFLSLIFIASALRYFSLINNLPSNFPINTVGVILLTMVVGWSPLRTWLAAADTVFMMPREVEMSNYLRLSFRYTTGGCLLLIAIALLLYLPIYNQGSSISGGWSLVLAAAALKAGNVWGAWRERQMTWPSMRRLMRLLRWALSALIWTVWLTCELWQGAAFVVLIGVLFLLVHRLPSRHLLPWERLIDEEARTRKRYYVFFGMFIDVPTLPSSIAKRSYLSWIMGVVPYANRSTFVYLYTASLLRSEIGGILIRLLLLGCLIIYWFADAVSLSGWGSLAIFVLFVGLIAAQLGGLRHVHRYSVWKHVYPLPEKQRVAQYLKVDRMALLLCILPLWLFAAIPLALSNVYLPSVVAAAVVLIYVVIRPSRLIKKLHVDAEEE